MRGWVSLLAITTAAVAPDWFIFFSRIIRWGQSDVFDYRRFLERAIEAAGPPLLFEENPPPHLFENLHFPFRKETFINDLDEFLAANKTTSTPAWVRSCPTFRKDFTRNVG
jgi:hypothetical protein